MLYAITKGTYLGLCVVFIKPNEYPQEGMYAAISFGAKDSDGGIDPLDIPEKDVTSGLKAGILDKIRRIPPELYKLCCNEYVERIKRKEETNDESTD